MDLRGSDDFISRDVRCSCTGASASRAVGHRGANGRAADSVRFRRPQLLLLSERLERSRLLLVRLCLPPRTRLGRRPRLAWLGSSSAAYARRPWPSPSYGRRAWPASTHGWRTRWLSSPNGLATGWWTIWHIPERLRQRTQRWRRTWRWWTWRWWTRSSPLSPRQPGVIIMSQGARIISGLFFYSESPSAFATAHGYTAGTALRKCCVDGSGRPLA